MKCELKQTRFQDRVIIVAGLLTTAFFINWDIISRNKWGNTWGSSAAVADGDTVVLARGTVPELDEGEEELSRRTVPVVDKDAEAFSRVAVPVDVEKLGFRRSTLITVGLLLIITVKYLEVRAMILKSPL